MNRNKLKINQLIDIELEMYTGDDGIPVYEYLPSRIEDITKDRLTIAMPFKHGYPVPIRVGETIRLKFIQDKEAYMCTVQVVGRHINPVAVLKVAMPEEVVHIQQRNWVRFEHIMPVNYKMHGYNMSFFHALSIDISGGGILVQTKHPIDVKEVLDIEFCLEKRPINVVGEVVRCLPQVDSFRIAIKFKEISEKDQDRIVGFIFQKQREIIQKGLV